MEEAEPVGLKGLAGHGGDLLGLEICLKQGAFAVGTRRQDGNRCP